MSARALLRDVTDGLRAQPGRTALAAAAVSIGVASLSMLLAVLGGLELRARRLVNDLGADVVAVVQAEARAQSRAPVLRPAHADYLRANLPEATISAIRRYRIPQPGAEAALTLIATDEHLARVRQWGLANGRFLDAADLTQAQRHAVITRRVAEAWGWRIGDSFPAGQTVFTIVGVVDAGGDALEAAAAESALVPGEWTVFVPMTVRPGWLAGAERPAERLDAIFVRAPGIASDRSIARLNRLLSHPDWRADGLSWITPGVLLRDIRRLQSTLSLAAGGITFLCLLLGGVTLASMMVANVRQRFVEIGLRRALGATRGDIALLFVAEGATVTLAAGLAGTLAAHGALAIAAMVRPDLPLYTGALSWAAPMAAAALLGMLCSFAPARTAARLVPAEAMRND